ncbi:RNA polymerase sigma-70 factor (ECF subfamily) [Allocatelliglobosispora scoriae]|uniref:RNA polymerase sigma-70 factor (ECF subfamily) n=1 Tax=Allocatelliglobosispora scoriae TaxID=643052 RepID=A0A841BVB0_9ACTN|nr:sigma-70 family RNA polymerase sigma factor [Allocatelliglobosispora scoriae]MBB5871099.1 RNA polymerase sigma-70 factor (ECF subfamily) [Allocatelliglobosispora scoriae]
MDDFKDFYEARKDMVFRAVFAATSDRAGAEDASAEGFARAFARWSKVGRHPNPTGWVLRTALNFHRSWWRRVRRELLGNTPDRPDGGRPDNGLDIDLHAAIAALPTRQREVIGLRILADLSPAETGEVLGIAPTTVNVHLHRALGSLRARLNEGVVR